MNLKVLRYGMKDKLVGIWQSYLKGKSLYDLSIDNHFGPGTLKGTKLFEKKNKIAEDGIVDDVLWGFALADGLCIGGSRGDYPEMPDFPPLSYKERPLVLGEIQYVAAPVAGNREAIRITNNWQRENLTRVIIPQLRGIKGAPVDGNIFWHKKAKDQLVEFFNEVEKEGLKDRLLTWGGSWVPRFVRNRPGTLSNHSYATAFDINVPWNWLGNNPAPIGEKGSVMELVPIAAKYGFFWGGWFNYKRVEEIVDGETVFKTVKKGTGRVDGMHFEIAKLL